MTTPVPQGAVRFESGTNSKLVLDVTATGGVIQQQLNESSPTQLWRLIPVTGARDLYHIARFGDDARVLAAAGQVTLAVQPLVPSSAAHRWALRQVSGETYAIENQQGGGVLSVVDASSEPGASIILWENLNQHNQIWRLVGGLPRAGMTSLEGLIGGVPLCDWGPIPRQVNDRSHTPIIVELYEHPLSRYSVWPRGRRGIITQTTNFHDTSRPGGSVIRTIGHVSAVVVRPGPDFNSELLYKVTLFDLPTFEGFQMPLTVGVYPDLHCYLFGERADSALFEQGTPKNFTEEFSASAPYFRSLTA